MMAVAILTVVLCACCADDMLSGDQRVLSNSTVCEESDFKYKPRLGDALLFHSLDPDNSINMRSLHGGCPVIKGTKWVVTKWLHNKPLQKGGFGWN